MNRRIGAAAAALLAGASLALTVRTITRRPQRDFQGKVVAITGGSRGLGLALAREFARRGASVALCARDCAELERAVDELSVEGFDAFGIDADVRRQSDVERFIAATQERWGAIDVLVHNAGIIQVGPMETMTIDDYRDAMDTHFWAGVYAVEAALPAMRCRGTGRIVTIASIGGLVSVPHLLPYCASKFALVGYSLGLAQELARENIGVTTICPGLMRTESYHFAHFKGQREKEAAWFSALAKSPVTAIACRAAARRIVDATSDGEGLVILSKQAQLLALGEGNFPNLVARVNALVNRLLPRAA
jgi:NAD(P)-dependent dehydrogenase (short-subunit alcohol dehydrogenase family)